MQNLNARSNFALAVLGGTCWIYTRSVCGGFAIDVELIKFGITIVRNLRTGSVLLVGVLAFLRDGPSSFRLVRGDGLLALPSARHHDRVQPFCPPIRQRLPPHPGRLPLRPSTIRAQPLSCKTVNILRYTCCCYDAKYANYLSCGMLWYIRPQLKTF